MNRSTCYGLAGLWATLALSALPAVAQNNWPAFRGPSADGHADDADLPVTWSEDENIFWKTPIHGKAWSSPIVWGHQIWLTTATADGHDSSALCLDFETGDIIHDLPMFHVETPVESHSFNSYSSPTPCIEDGRVYVSWGSAGTACIDTETADVLWSRRDLECNHYRGPGSSPIIFEDLLLCHYDGFDYQYVIALNKATGDTVWRTERPHDFGTDNGDMKKAFATPLVIEVNGRQQLISPCSKGTFAYDPRTGEEIWRVRYEGFSTACRPLYEDGMLIISSGFSRAELLAVDPTGEGDVTDTHIRWIETRQMPSKPSPLWVDGRIYTIHDQGVISCLDGMTGEIIWSDRAGGNFTASPIYAGGRIYIPSEEGGTLVVAPGDSYNVLATNMLDAGALSSPAVVGDSLLLRTTTHLYRIGDASAGE